MILSEADRKAKGEETNLNRNSLESFGDIIYRLGEYIEEEKENFVETPFLDAWTN